MLLADQLEAIRLRYVSSSDAHGEALLEQAYADIAMLLAEVKRSKADTNIAVEGFVLAMAQCDLTWSVAVKGQGKENPDKAQYQKNQTRLNELWAEVANLLTDI